MWPKVEISVGNLCVFTRYIIQNLPNPRKSGFVYNSCLFFSIESLSLDGAPVPTESPSARRRGFWQSEPGSARIWGTLINTVFTHLPHWDEMRPNVLISVGNPGISTRAKIGQNLPSGWIREIGYISFLFFLVVSLSIDGAPPESSSDRRQRVLTIRVRQRTIWLPRVVMSSVITHFPDCYEMSSNV